MNKTKFDAFIDTLMDSYSESDLLEAELISKLSADIASVRVELGLNQKELACKLGISQPMVSKIESGNYNFTISLLCKIFCKLGKKINIQIEDKSVSKPVPLSYEKMSRNRNISSAYKDYRNNISSIGISA